MRSTVSVGQLFPDSRAGHEERALLVRKECLIYIHEFREANFNLLQLKPICLNGRGARLFVSFRLNPGSIVAIDRGYIDYALFGRWSVAGVFFVPT